jgi:glyoxylase-like metal-dependent hydrolase (beta-lactamase superfamily II)
VNVAVFETSAGLVLIDTGYAPAGPALRDALRKISAKRVHTIVYTHHHVDHMLGAWALLEAGERPQIVATAELADEVDRDLRSAELTARYNNQAPEEAPHSRAELPMPTRTFHGRLVLDIGRDRFVLTHAPGETADQLWVSVPTRHAIVTADYFQPFLPNAGNGKRRQRYVGSWAQALREMAALRPAIALPMHGAALTSTTEIVDRFEAQAAMLESIERQTLAGLNAGLRREEAAARVTLPPELAAREDAKELYVTARDIGAMVAQEYTGWWDGLAADWSPAPRAAQAREIAALAGGVDPLVARARALAPTDLPLACNLADLAWLAAPSDPAVLAAGTDLYLQRLRAGVPTQEAIEYIEHLVRLRAARDALAGQPETAP